MDPGCKMNHEKLVREFFEQNGKFPLPEGKEGLDLHYLDVGLLDSFGIVTMIADFEGALGIIFTAEDMQSYEFQTVGGLIGIMDRLASRSA
jgi:acyl carrier protein